MVHHVAYSRPKGNLSSCHPRARLECAFGLTPMTGSVRLMRKMVISSRIQRGRDAIVELARRFGSLLSARHSKIDFSSLVQQLPLHTTRGVCDAGPNKVASA